MTDRPPHRHEDAAEGPPPAAEQGPLVYSSAELFRGRREVWIEHGADMYRLRLTAANKLYLTK